LTVINHTLPHLILPNKCGLLVAFGSNRVGATHVFPYQRQLTRTITICIENIIETSNKRQLNIACSTH